MRAKDDSPDDRAGERLAARIYLRGAKLADARKPKMKRAMPDFIHAALLGNLDGLWACGNALRRGHGVPKNLRLAFLILHRAAKLGHSKAQFSVGVCYAFGEGVGRNPKLAYHWYLLAAKQRVPQAMYNVGWYLHRGKGVARSDSEAVKWLRRAHRMGDTEAAVWLGNIYGERNHRGDALRSRRLYEWAAKRGDVDAKKNLKRFFATRD